MSKYISLDDLQTYPFRIDHYDKDHGNEHFIYGCESVIEYAENLPTIDIVRCKDCKRWNRGYFQEYMCHSDVITGPNDYCSYGEKKEESNGENQT